MDNQEEIFNLYLEELVKWNEKFNLTSITDPKDIRIKHFKDSLSIDQAIKLTNQRVADVGSGAGFPSIPLKIVYPNISLTIIEATAKKVKFLKHLVKVLELKDVEVIWGRAEEIGREKREEFDLVVARAVAKLNLLAEICLPLVKVGGVFVAQKADDCSQEVAEAKNSISLLGGTLVEIKKITLPDLNIIRSLIIINKVKQTLSKYPRPMREIRQSPL
jgi:16S rRNA (guanine527-N7)-methyltransferase